jgi:hypothetical protein
VSGVAVISYVLGTLPALTAIVPTTSIFGGDAPKGSKLPVIVMEQISDVERNTVSMGEARRLMSERVQVTVIASSYPAQKQLLGLVRSACAHRTGLVNGVDVVSITPLGAGPDMCDAAGLIYSQPVDFLVKWRRSA